MSAGNFIDKIRLLKPACSSYYIAKSLIASGFLFLEVSILTALVDLVLNGIVYCTKGMQVNVEKKSRKYSTVSRIDSSQKEPKEIKFNVSNELMPLYFV